MQEVQQIVVFRGLQENKRLTTVSVSQFTNGSKPSQIMAWLTSQNYISKNEMLVFLTRNGYVWTDQSPWKLGQVLRSYMEQLNHEVKCASGFCTDDLNRRGFCVFSKSQSMALGGSYEEQKRQGWGQSMPLYLIPPLSVLVRYVNAQGNLKNISLWTPSDQTLRTRLGFLMAPQTKDATTMLFGRVKSVHQDHSARSLRGPTGNDKASYLTRVVQIPSRITRYLFAPRSITDVERSPFSNMSSSVKMY